MQGIARETARGDADRFRTLYRLMAGLSRAKSLQDVYHAAVTSLLEATEADRAAILLFDEDGVMRFKASNGLSNAYQQAVTGHTPWSPGEEEAKPLVIPDVLDDESLAAYRRVFDEENIRALAFIPIALDAGVIGKFMLYYAAPHDFGAEEIEIAEAIATHVALFTQHKHEELARIASEQRLQAILDNSPAVVFVKDLQGHYLLVNRRHEELFHRSRAEVVGKTDLDLFPAELAEQFRANDRVVLKAGKPVAIEEQAPHDDGMHSYLAVKFPIQGIDGKVAGICGIATDITERKKLEQASQYLAAIVESADVAIASKDLDGIITSWNRGAEQVLGYRAEEVVGKPISILAPEGYSDDMAGILAKIRRGESVEHHETKRRRKDGQIIDVALTVSPVRDAAGKVIGASKFIRDVTQWKQVERERETLLSREREARRTAELLNRVGSRLGAQLELEKLVQEVTDIARALVGAEFGAFFFRDKSSNEKPYALSALAGISQEAFDRLPLAHDPVLLEAACHNGAVVRSDDLTEDQGDGQPGSGQSCGELTIRSYLSAPVVSRNRETLGCLVFGHPAAARFTENHAAIVTGIAAQAAIAVDNARLFEQAQWIQAELKRSNEELRRANEDLEVFAYSASHDLREPLRTIAISAQIIDRDGGCALQRDHAAFLNNILRAANRMTVLMDDILAYTRATKREEGPTPKIESRRVLDDVLNSLGGLIEEAGAVITSGELPAVEVRASRLAQLLQNLLSNAIKYRSKEAPRVHVSARERDGWHIFSIVDNGIGIEPQFAEQIFGIFKRLHCRDDYPGSGIGLSICQRVAEQYGGRVWLEHSEPGHGSTFCFSIPSRS